MKIRVIGKQHLQGVSKKTNKPYDFIQVHYTGRENGVEGLAAKTLMLEPKTYPIESITLGIDYNAEFNDRGYLAYFEPLPAPPSK